MRVFVRVCMHCVLCVQFQKQNQDTLRLCVDVQWQPLKTTYSFKMSIYSEPSNSSALFVSIWGKNAANYPVFYLYQSELVSEAQGL